MDNNIISNLVSELFKHINSKESFNYISHLLVNSLGDYKKKLQIENYKENKKSSLSEILHDEFQNSQYMITSPEDDYLAISNDIHAILSNCSELNNIQKLEFCTNQRYFMKLFLKNLLKKLNYV